MLRHLIRPLALLKRPCNIMAPQIVCAFNTTNKTYKTYNKKPVVKEQNMGSIMVRNDNLRFQTEGYLMLFYPFHPEVIKKSSNLYEINKSSAVLALNFIEKSSDGTQISSETAKQNWKNRKSIAFRFNEIAKFMEINPNEDGTWKIQVDRSFKDKKKLKTMIFTNQKKSKVFNITLEQDSSEDIKWKIETKMEHSEFSLFQLLLKESLCDLSGMKLMFDLRRNEELAKIGQKDRAEVEKQSLFKSYDNKDDVI